MTANNCPLPTFTIPASRSMAAPVDSSATTEGSASPPAPVPSVQPTGVSNPVSILQSLAPLTLKLDRGNYTFWKSQVLPSLRAHDLEGFVLGTKSTILLTPEYT
ncbi:hypothetical protein G4B88_003509 [Cannabis sativa]|uniref:Retrotransposon Copia-like N-terminal domain-containing protein n=1 Tax=Cannabis sativa TaxID=3483 RepID=A0A7J6GTM1_CANSA|nr:hypothetical protein G4B88_003509 [Cannabis sativa]